MTSPSAPPGGSGRSIDELIANLESINKKLTRDYERERQESLEADRLLAARARSGELGSHWQRTQARIDRGLTTLDDVFAGRDDSADAKSLRETSQRNMARLREQWEEQSEAGEETPVDELLALRDHLIAESSRLREIIDEERGDDR